LVLEQSLLSEFGIQSKVRGEIMQDDTIIFAEENDVENHEVQDVWKVLIVDDEVEVHSVTRLVLENFIFEEKKLS